MEWIKCQNSHNRFYAMHRLPKQGQTETVCENHTFPGTITLSSMHCGLCLSAPLWRSEDKKRDGVSIFPRRQFLIVLLLLTVVCSGSSVCLQSDDTFLAMRRMAFAWQSLTPVDNPSTDLNISRQHSQVSKSITRLSHTNVVQS